MIVKRVYVLISDDEKKKMQFQERLMGYLCENNEKNKKYKLKQIYYSKNLNEIFFSIDDLQHISQKNNEIRKYVNDFYEDKKCDLWIISCRPNLEDLEILIKESHSNFLNITGVFFEEYINTCKEDGRKIAQLGFDERIILSNSINKINGENEIEEVVGNEEYICQDFANMLLIRSYFM